LAICSVQGALTGATSAGQTAENPAALDAVEEIDESLIRQLHGIFPADGGFFG
jgi:hypothetical protein